MRRAYPVLLSLALAVPVLTGCGGQTAETTSAFPDATSIVLSDDGVTVDGEAAPTDETAAVYTAHDIVYYEAGRDFTYGEGTEADEHTAEEAAAHTVVHITQPGTYRLSGTLSAGQVAVDLGEDAQDDSSAVVTVILDGVDVTELSDRQLAHIRNKQIGFIFQGFNLIPALNAWENVELPLIYQGVPASKRADRVEAALERVGLAERAGHKPTEMSGGQQQRVAIARAIATQPPIIMADEPTGALDSRTGKHVLEILHGLHDDGSTIILITHDNGIAATAERVVRISDGHIIYDGDREGAFL